MKIILFVLTLFIINYGFSQKVKSIWESSINNDIHEIKCLGCDDFSDLEVLGEILQDKQYVFIGESSHEVAEFPILRTRIVKYLHEKLGFDVILFELDMCIASAFEYLNDTVSIADATEFINYYFNALEMQGLAVYIRENNIHTSGFDVQIPRNYNLFHKAVSMAFPVSDSCLFYDSLVTNHYSRQIIYRSGECWNDLYQQYKDSGKTTMQNCILKGISTRINWIKRIPNISTTLRDSIMSENLLWLIRNVYPDKKVIIWAHNEHISKENDAFDDHGAKSGVWSSGSMGSRMPDSIRNKSYVLGLYAFQGQTYNYGPPVCTIVASKPNSLGAVFNAAGFEIGFADFSQQTPNKSNSWMFQKIDVVSYCFQRYKMIPADRYDGIIMINTVHPITIKNGTN